MGRFSCDKKDKDCRDNKSERKSNSERNGKGVDDFSYSVEMNGDGTYTVVMHDPIIVTGKPEPEPIRDKNDHRNGNDRPKQDSSISTPKVTGSNKIDPLEVDNIDIVWRGGFKRRTEENPALAKERRVLEILYSFEEDIGGAPFTVKELVQNKQWGKASDLLLENYQRNPTYNLADLEVLQYVFNQAAKINQTTEDIKNALPALDLILSSSEEMIGKLDKPLKNTLKKSLYDFKYTPDQVGKAQRRYSQFMQGKKFKISNHDQQIIDKMRNIQTLRQYQKNVAQLTKGFAVLNVVNKVADIASLVTEFDQANKTGDWTKFAAKIGALSATVLITSLAAFVATPSIPVALIVGVGTALVSNYFGDEERWERWLRNSKPYLQQ